MDFGEGLLADILVLLLHTGRKCLSTHSVSKVVVVEVKVNDGGLGGGLLGSHGCELGSGHTDKDN